MKRQIAINIIRRGGVCKCIAAHYHKAGWRDLLESRIVPHFGIMTIDEPKEQST